MTDFLQQLRRANQERMLEWDPDGKLSSLFYAVELAGEVGEACNVVKKLEREQAGIPGSRSTPVALEEELADIVIVVDLLAERYGIDLATAIAQKFNTTSRNRGFRTMFSNVGSSDPLVSKEGWHSIVSKEGWLKLPLALRERYWQETDYGKRPASAELITAVKAALGIAATELENEK